MVTELMVVPLVVNDEPEYRLLMKIEDPLIGIKMSLYLKVMLPQDTRYYLKTRNLKYEN
jgi:hypothetical protein